MIASSTFTATSLDPSCVHFESEAVAEASARGKHLVVVTSFKAFNGASGKYVDGRVYEVDSSMEVFHIHEAFQDEIMERDEDQELFRLVEVPGHPHNHPKLFSPRFVHRAAIVVFDKDSAYAADVAADSLKSYGKREDGNTFGSVTLITKYPDACTIAADLAAALRG